MKSDTIMCFDKRVFVLDGVQVFVLVQHVEQRHRPNNYKKVACPFCAEDELGSMCQYPGAIGAQNGCEFLESPSFATKCPLQEAE